MRDLSTVRKLKIDPSSSFDFRVGAMLKVRGVLRCSKYFFSRFILIYIEMEILKTLMRGSDRFTSFLESCCRFVKQT